MRLFGTTAVSPPDPGDQWAYWQAMQKFGQGGELFAPAVSFSMGSCTANLSGSDDVYQDRCPQPWVNIDAQPTWQTARAIFPKDYFVFVQRYISTALSLKPPDNASAKAKILWLLDVQTVATIGLLMLNIPLRGQNYTRRGFVGLPDADPTPSHETASPVLQPFLAAQKIFYDNLALARFAGFSSQQLSDPKYKADLAAATIMPAALASLPVFWIGNAYRQWKGFDQVYVLLFGGVIPTAASNWYSIPSYGNKDAASIKDAVARDDQPLLRALYQWRMWSVRDGMADTYVDPSIAPLGLGTATNTVNLNDYIAHVTSYERPVPEMVLQNGRLYPNFAQSYQGASRIAAQILSVNYELEIRKHMGAWAARNAPRVDASGNPLFDKQIGQYAQQPVTYTDNDALLRGLAQQVADRAKLAVANPGYACGDDKACQTAWTGATVKGTQVPGFSSVYAIAQKSPLGPFIAGGLAIASLLVNKFGAAIGGGYWPFFTIDQPLVRTFTAAAYRTVPDGSSVDVLMRVMLAVQALEKLTGLALLTPPPPLPLKPPVTEVTGPVVPPGTDQSSSPDPCKALLQSWANMNPAKDACLTPYDRSAMLTTCHAAQSGRMTQAKANATIEQIVDAACAKKKTGTFGKVALVAVGLATVGGAATVIVRARAKR